MGSLVKRVNNSPNNGATKTQRHEVYKSMPSAYWVRHKVFRADLADLRRKRSCKPACPVCRQAGRLGLFMAGRLVDLLVRELS